MLGLRRVAAVSALGGCLAACSSGGDLTPPPNGGTFKVGAPYEIGDQWYYPQEQPEYDETGIASWYGPSFYGHRTANGEIFDASAMTAAHRTLPMPVNVRVTNLDNGRTVILRVNDRGPYAKSRIIDVSEHAAEVLGFKGAGTAHVRVQYLARADGNAPSSDYDDVALNARPAPSVSDSSGADDAAEAARTAALNAGSIGVTAGAGVASAAVHTPPAVAASVVPVPAVSSDGDNDPSPDDGAVADDDAVVDGSGAVAASDLPPPNDAAPSGSAPVTVASLDAPQSLPQSAPTPPPQPPANSMTASAAAGSAATRPDLTPMIGGDPNAPAPPPLTEQHDSAAGQQVVAAGTAPPPASANQPAVAVWHSMPAPAAHTKIYVQAGAFSSRSNADHLSSTLAAIGAAFVSPIEKAGAELYRVRMGPFDDIGEATSALARVTGLGNTGAKIVVDQ